MKLFGHLPRDPFPTPSPGPALLRDGVLLAPWFIAYELDKEMERARRHGRPLTAVVLRAAVGQLPPGEVETAIHAAAKTAVAISRTTDLIGWLPDWGILVIMPETDTPQAQAAAYRWRAEMHARGWHLRAPQWELEQTICPLEFADADAMLAALARLPQRHAA
jgi:hypothetical protein